MAHERNILLLLAAMLGCSSTWGREGGKARPVTRIYVAPAIGIYEINRKHASKLSQRTGVLFGAKREWPIGHEHRAYFSVGGEFLLHGVNFNSYYFKPGEVKIYDRNFAYNYTVYFQELGVPFQYKLLFKRADNSQYSGYAIAGYHLRYLLGSTVDITSQGSRIKSDSPPVTFRNPLFTPALNSFASLGIGWQRNSKGAALSGFFIEVNARYGFSSYSFSRDYSPSSLYVSGAHFFLLMGLKF
jgi:hypothetical protein